MSNVDAWIKQTLTDLRKLDRRTQRTHLENLLKTVDQAQREGLRHEIEARRTRVQGELRTYQTRRRPDALRKMTQKEAMIDRYTWLLHIIDHYISLPDSVLKGN